MYNKKISKLEDVREMLYNNKLMKKPDSTEEASGLIVKGQRGRSLGDPKEILMLPAVMLASTEENQGTSRKIV